MSGAQKVPQDAKKEEFRKYLEKAGVLELLTKSLVQLYEEPQKPDDALGYLKKSVGGSLEDKRTIEVLHKENEELKKKVAELESRQVELQAKLSSLQEVPAVPFPAAVSEAAAAAPAEVAEPPPPAPADIPTIAQEDKVEVSHPEQPAAPEAAEEPMETEGDAVTEPAVAAAAVTALPPTPPVSSDPVPPPDVASASGDSTAPAVVEG